MKWLFLILLLLAPSVCGAGDARWLFLAASNVTNGTITLNADGTYSKSGPAVVTYVNPYFTVTFPATTSTLTVTAAGAAGGSSSGTGFGKGAIVTATVPVSGGPTLTAKIGVQPANGAQTGGYGGGRGGDGLTSSGYYGGGGSTSLANGSTIILEAGAGQGGQGSGSPYDAVGDTTPGSVQDATHGNQNGNTFCTNCGTGGGWTLAYNGASSKIVSPATGSFSTGASGNSGTGRMTIVY